MLCEKNMDIRNEAIKQEINKQLIVIKTECKYENISKLDIKTEKEPRFTSDVEREQDGQITLIGVKKGPNVDTFRYEIDKVKIEPCSSEENEVGAFGTEEILVKTEIKDKDRETRFLCERKLNSWDKKHGFHYCDMMLVKYEDAGKIGETNNSEQRSPKRDNTSLKKYRCLQCEYRSKWKHDLTAHILAKHNILKNHTCDHCDYRTHNKRHLRNHVMSKHKTRKYGCDYCNYRTHYKIDMRRHLTCKHDKSAIKKYSCDHCDYRSHRKCYVKFHTLNKHDKAALKRYSCAHCDYRSHYKKNLSCHLSSKHKNINLLKQRSCDQWTFKTNWDNNLKIHIATQHETNSIKQS